MNTSFSPLWLGFRPIDAAVSGSIAIRCSERIDREGAAVTELIKALSSMLPGAELTFGADSAGYIIELDIASFLDNEEYTVSADERGASVIGGSDIGLLYGVFAYIRTIAKIEPITFLPDE